MALPETSLGPRAKLGQACWRCIGSLISLPARRLGRPRRRHNVFRYESIQPCVSSHAMPKATWGGALVTGQATDGKRICSLAVITELAILLASLGHVECAIAGHVTPARLVCMQGLQHPVSRKPLTTVLLVAATSSFLLPVSACTKVSRICYLYDAVSKAPLPPRKPPRPRCPPPRPPRPRPL